MSRVLATASPLADVVDRQRAAEQQRALRALLRHPLLTPTGPDPAAFRLVRAHADVLQRWCAAQAGWSLEVRADLVRLRKTAPQSDAAARPAVDRSGVAFSRRRYVLVCLAAAVLAGDGRPQTTLGTLARGVVLAARDPALAASGLVFAIEDRQERSDLVAAVRLLIAVGVLMRVAGQEESFLRASGDALYDVDRRVLGALLVTARGPSTVTAAGFEDRLSGLAAAFMPDTDDARRLAIRHELTRRLLDDPVLYVEDLDDEERAYWTNQRTALVDRVAAATGFTAEARAEGTAMLDETEEATDARMPEQGTDGHATLLLAEHLAAAEPGQTVPHHELRAWLAPLAAEHAGRHWRTDTAAEVGQTVLLERAVDRLVALDLAVRTPEGVRARPALARFAVAAPRVAGHQEPLG